MFRKKPWQDTDITGWRYSIKPGESKNSWRVWITDPEGNKYGSHFGLLDYCTYEARTLEKAEAKVVDSIKKTAYEQTTLVSVTIL
jgi:hypothetical protein